MQRSTIRTIQRLALGAVLAGGVWLGLAALSTAAHADDRPAQQPRGTLGTVVDQVLPVPSTPAEPEPEPTTEPAPPAAPEQEPAPEPAEPEQDAPGDEPTQTPDEPAADPVVEVPPAEVPVDVPPVVVTPPPVADVPPVVVDPPPVTPAPTAPVVVPTPTIPPVTPPATSPAPSPVVVVVPRDDELGLGEAPETEQPAPAPIPTTMPVPVDLAVVIGPIATTTVPLVDDGIYPPGTLPDPAPTIPDCDDADQADDQPGHTRGDGKQQRRSHHGAAPDTATERPRPGAPCPGKDGNPGPAIASPAMKPPSPGAEQLVALNAAGVYSSPVLHRLTQLRPRSKTLTGRTEHPEPGPA